MVKKKVRKKKSKKRVEGRIYGDPPPPHRHPALASLKTWKKQVMTLSKGPMLHGGIGKDRLKLIGEIHQRILCTRDPLGLSEDLYRIITLLKWGADVEAGTFLGLTTALMETCETLGDEKDKHTSAVEEKKPKGAAEKKKGMARKNPKRKRTARKPLLSKMPAAKKMGKKVNWQ